MNDGRAGKEHYVVLDLDAADEQAAVAPGTPTVVLGRGLAFQVADPAGEIRDQDCALDGLVAYRRLAGDGGQVIAAVLVKVDGHGPAAGHGPARATQEEYRQTLSQTLGG